MKNFFKITTFADKLKTIWISLVIISTILSLFLPTNGDSGLIGKNLGTGLTIGIFYGAIISGTIASIWHNIINKNKD